MWRITLTYHKRPIYEPIKLVTINITDYIESYMTVHSAILVDLRAGDPV